MNEVRHLGSTHVMFDALFDTWIVEDRPHGVLECFQTRSEAERFCLMFFLSLIEQQNRSLILN